MKALTIIMPSWNKEAYIAEALDSVFAQKTKYTYEILIADDHSTDRTLEIVAEYEATHPGVIRVLRSEKNQKLFRNVRRAYAECKTPFFCVLDPDDYWMDELHLEKALNYLNENPDFTIYSTEIEMLNRDGTRKLYGFPQEVVDSDFADYLANRSVIAFTNSCVYRNVVFTNGLPELVANPSHQSMERSFRGDSFRNFIHLQHGKAHYCPEVSACYRITDAGVYQSLTEAQRIQLNIDLFLDLYRFSGKKYKRLLSIARQYDRIKRKVCRKEAATRGEHQKSKLSDKIANYLFYLRVLWD